MDEAEFFKFGKWFDYRKSHPGEKISPERHLVWVTWPKKVLTYFNVSGMDEQWMKLFKPPKTAKSRVWGKVKGKEPKFLGD